MIKAPEKSIEFQIIDFTGAIPRRFLTCQEHLPAPGLHVSNPLFNKIDYLGFKLYLV